jgi:Tfp pilus tip-associated adhesin PilY1
MIKTRFMGSEQGQAGLIHLRKWSGDPNGSDVSPGTYHVAVRHSDELSGTGAYNLVVESQLTHIISATSSYGGTISPSGGVAVVDGGSQSFYDLDNGPYPVWPDSGTGADQRKIDDLWHAAVNGRGTFTSASNPIELRDSLVSIMQNVEARIGSASSVSINGDELYDEVSSDIRMFQASFNSDGWTGAIKAHQVDLATGTVVVDSYLWSAAAELENITATNRIIATYDGTQGIPFRFDAPRNRIQKLGDIIHSSPTHRAGYLYAGGNDGMLHVFDAADGKEVFAYIPKIVFENLKNLTDPLYTHQYYVDLSPVAKAVTFSGTDKTILEGGLGERAEEAIMPWTSRIRPP